MPGSLLIDRVEFRDPHTWCPPDWDTNDDEGGMVAIGSVPEIESGRRLFIAFVERLHFFSKQTT